jgi:hypothetical protein
LLKWKLLSQREKSSEGEKKMGRLLKLMFPCLLFLGLAIPLQANANTQTADRTEVFSILESAFEAQVSLSERERTLTEVEDVLDPYFTEEYKRLFLEENLVEENGQYFTYGSDFALYYIPFYDLSEKTKVVTFQDSIYIVEHFPASEEGPVIYDSHYEGIQLVNKNGGWKVAAYWYDDLPAEIIEEAYQSSSGTDFNANAKAETDNLLETDTMLNEEEESLAAVTASASGSFPLLASRLLEPKLEEEPPLLSFGFGPFGFHTALR